MVAGSTAGGGIHIITSNGLLFVEPGTPFIPSLTEVPSCLCHTESLPRPTLPKAEILFFSHTHSMLKEWELPSQVQINKDRGFLKVPGSVSWEPGEREESRLRAEAV